MRMRSCHLGWDATLRVLLAAQTATNGNFLCHEKDNMFTDDWAFF